MFKQVSRKWLIGTLLLAMMHGGVVGIVCLGVYGIATSQSFLLVGGALFGAIMGGLGRAIFLMADDLIGGSRGEAIAGGVCGLLLALIYATLLEMVLFFVLGLLLPTAIHWLFRQLRYGVNETSARVIGGMICGFFMGTLYGWLLLAGPWLNYWGVTGLMAGCVSAILYPYINQAVEQYLWEEP